MDKTMVSFQSNQKRWLCVEIACPQEHIDHLAMSVAERFALGTEIREGAIRFYLDESSFSGRWREALQEVLDEFESIVNLGRPLDCTTCCVYDEGWADRWKEHFKPLRVAEHFVIVPTWEEFQPAGEDIVIRMDPGRAFGTGHHETTRLCLEWLETWQRQRGGKERSLLDVGTGSGILAMAAALLRVGSVRAIDNDPEAVEVAQENIILNELAEKVRLMCGELADVSGLYDVVIANIQALPLIELAPQLAARVKENGSLVLSGILLEQKQDLEKAFVSRRLRLHTELSAGEWCLLEFVHEAFQER